MPTQVKVGWRSFVSPVTSSYLLDTYVGATAAYSLRKLRTAYTGAAIRVRRSSDNTEQNIGFTSTGGLDTTALLSFVGAGNGFVTTWYDQGASGYNLTQSIASNQPSIVLSGVLNTQNNKPILITDYNSYMINSSLPLNGTTNSIFNVIKLTATRGAFAMMSGYSSYNQHWPSRDASGNNRYYDSNGQDITATPLPNGLNLIGIHENSSGVTVYENGKNIVSNFTHNVNNTTGIVIFRRDVSDGNYMPSGSGFSELIIYPNSSKLSSDSAISTDINSYYSIYSTLDTDAQAFITAASITDSTQQSAVNTLVTSLKSAGIWTKMKAIYPFVGGNATSHKFNLKDPRDLDAAYRLTFSGGWTHSSTGALPNGTTAYANTYFNPSFVYTVNNNSHLSFYSRTNSSINNNNDIGCTNTNVSPFVSNVITTFRADQSNRTFLFSNTSNGVFFTDTNSLGFYVSNRIGTQANGYKNGISKGSNTVSDEQRPNIFIVIGANNASSFGITQYSSKETAFASIGDGLTDAEATAFYTAVQTFQTTLGRHVGVPIVADTDAQAFLNAAEITSQTQASAINTLVTSLKSANIWTKMKAIYPFVGGTATSHKFNLKDPRDVDAAFRLQFYGGGTHGSNGFLQNYVNSWADTKFTPSNNFSSASKASFGIYSRTLRADNNRIAMGSNSGTGWIFIWLRNGNSTTTYVNSNFPAGSAHTTAQTNTTKGFFQSARNNSTTEQLLNVNNVNYNSTANSSSLSTNSIFIGSINGLDSGQYVDNLEIAFAYIGDDLSPTDLTNYYTAVQAFQTTLGRQV